ncbi:MAG TPA: hypothetical protein VGJ68_00490 [Bradyrhizobium sp.]|jgi:hypothetical protein
MKVSSGLSERLAADFADIFGGDGDVANDHKTGEDAMWKRNGIRSIHAGSLNSSAGMPPSTRVRRTPEAD